MKILKKHSDVKPYIERVSSEADSHRNCFGFLPISVYEQLSKKNCLWILVNDKGDYVGHIMFSIAWKKYKITVNQTYILSEYRKSHFASQLINELKNWAEKHYITELHANVAADLKVANSFYNSMGFSAVMQKEGGETTQRLINVRIAYLNTPTLLNLFTHKITDFSYNQPINIYRKYVIDINILLDLIENRAYSNQVQELIKGSFNGSFKLLITHETHVEVSRNAKNPDPLAKLIANIPSLSLITNIENTKEYKNLEKLVFGKIDTATKSAVHKISDLKHLTYCILNNCTGFITRDKQLLNKAKILGKEFNLDIISPEELILNEDCLSNRDTTISLNDLNYKFINISDDSSIINDCLSNLQISRETVQLPAFDGIAIKQEAQSYLACALWPKTIISNRGTIAYIFSNTLCNHELLDHIIETIFRVIKSKKVRSIAIFTYGLIAHIDEVLKTRGFSQTTENNGMIKYSHLITDRIITENNWASFKQVVNDNMSLSLPENLTEYKELITNGILLKNKDYYNFFEFETKFSPSLIIPKNRDIYVVPIRNTYAKELIGDDFDIQRSLSLSNCKPALLKTEKAYFNKPGKGTIKKGSIIMFYVSAPIKCIIGIARVTYSNKLRCEEAMDMLTLQGVLEKDKLLEISKDGFIDVFTFDNFHQYNKNVDIKFLTTLGVGKNSFVTKFKINRENFLKICAQGGIYGK